MLSLLDALSIDKAILVGHSMGGAIAIQTTLLAPERVQGLGLVATGARLKVNPTVLEGLQHETLGTIRRIVRWMYAHELSTRTIVIGAEHDKMTPPRLSEELALAIRRAELVTIPNAGHMVMLEHPQAVCDALTSFVKRLQQESRSR